MHTRLASLALALALPLTGCVHYELVDPVEPAATPGDVVVLLHGLGRSAASMAPMADCLDDAGYRTARWDYPSSSYSVEEHSAELQRLLQVLDGREDIDQIHLVTHSLGGIVVRHALAQSTVDSLGRVVMLAPPNQGSPAAEKLSPMLDSVLVPLPQLSERPDNLVHVLPMPEDVVFGVIAGARDEKVPPAYSHLAGQADHVVVDSAHTMIMGRDDVCAHTTRFLEAGAFLYEGQLEGEGPGE
jgi:triacylglycerol lipase